jgi:hypothetical protein
LLVFLGKIKQSFNGYVLGILTKPNLSRGLPFSNEGQKD